MAIMERASRGIRMIMVVFMDMQITAQSDQNTRKMVATTS